MIHGEKKRSKQANRAFDLEERLLDFAVSTCEVAEYLPASRLGIHVNNQILRSCTSPAPNYGEAQSAESRKDFVHKLKLCLKELRETQVWLRIIEKKGLAEEIQLQALIKECNELISIFVKSVQTAEKNQQKRANSKSKIKRP